MTEYTADDFERARFATDKSGWNVACRDRPQDDLPWLVGKTAHRASDNDLARSSWVPVSAGSDTRTDEEDWQARAETADPSVDYRAMWWKAEKEREEAEQERDEARRHECSDLDAHWRLDEALAAHRECHEQRDAAIAHAEKVEQERDDLREQLEAQKPAVIREHRPLTPDAITDEMVERAAHRMAMREMPVTYSGDPTETAGQFYYLAREALHAALTEPPARPEELTRLIDTIREATYDPEPVATGEALYNAGVRVTGAES